MSFFKGRNNRSEGQKAEGLERLYVNARLVDQDLDCPGSLLTAGGRIREVFPGDPEGSAFKGRTEAGPCAAGSCAAGSFAATASSPAGSCAAAASGDAVFGGVEVIDAKGLVLTPSFIDLHAHFRDPGYTHKEDLTSGSRAACAGGYGTVVLMANTDPVVSDAAHARAVRERAAETGLVDVYQAVSLTRAFDGKDVSALAALDSREVPIATEDGREVASAAVMLSALKLCAERGVTVSCHCEDPELAAAAKPFREAALAAARDAGLAPGVLSVPGGFVPTKSPPSAAPGVREHLAEAERLLALAEDVMTERNLLLARSAACRVHIAHASTARAIDAVRRAKADAAASCEAGTNEKTSPDAGASTSGFRVTCEVTPHHLALDDSIPAVVNPPLRPARDREAVVAGILDGTVDAIATDHAPHTTADKAAGAPGFSGIQSAFAVCNTVLVRSGLIPLSRLSQLMSAHPACILGLGESKGRLAAGCAADLVLLDPDSPCVFSGESPSGGNTSHWFSRSANGAPYASSPACAQLYGRIEAVWKDGELAYTRE